MVEVQVFTDPEYIEKHLSEKELQELTEAFKKFKSGYTVDLFGRDALYDSPHTLSSVKMAELWHTHMWDEQIPFKRWRRKDSYYRTSDKHLVYCENFFVDNCYLLIAVLDPDAHNQAHNNSLMLNLAATAEIFRNKKDPEND